MLLKSEFLSLSSSLTLLHSLLSVRVVIWSRGFFRSLWGPTETLSTAQVTSNHLTFSIWKVRVQATALSQCMNATLFLVNFHFANFVNVTHHKEYTSKNLNVKTCNDVTVMNNDSLCTLCEKQEANENDISQSKKTLWTHPVISTSQTAFNFHILIRATLLDGSRIGRKFFSRDITYRCSFIL